MKFVFSAAALALLALGWPGTAAATNGYFSHGYGAKNESMAGAGIAFSEDAIAPAINPAGIAWLPERLDFGVDWFVPSRGGSIRGNFFGPDASYSGDGLKNFAIPSFGYVRPLNKHWVFGFTMYGNGGMNTTYEDANPFARFGSTGTAGVNLMQMFVGPTLAWKINPHHSLALSVNYALQLFKATGLNAFAGTSFPGPYSESPGHVTNQGFDSSQGVGYHIGWQAHYQYISFGATWQPKTHMSRFDKYRGLFANQGSFDIPGWWGVGIAVHPTQQLTIAFDYQRILYGEVESIANPIGNFQSASSPLAGTSPLLPPGLPLPIGPTFLDLVNALNANALTAPLLQQVATAAAGRYGALLGSDNGPGFGWRSINVYKLGLNYKATETITLRAGYSRNGQPIPQSQTLFNILAPGVVTRHYTLGGTWRHGHHEITFNYMYAPKETVHGKNSIPDAAIPIPPDSFGGGEADIWLKERIIGLSYGYLF